MPTPCSFPTRFYRESNPRGFAKRGQRYVLDLMGGGGADWRRCRDKGAWWCRTGRTTSSSEASSPVGSASCTRSRSESDGGASFRGEAGPGTVNKTSVPVLAARLYVPASPDKSSGLCNDVSWALMVWV